MKPVCDNIIEFGIIFLILFTPLAFGSVYVWAFSIMEITVFSMLIALIVKNGLIRRGRFSFPLFFPIIAFLGLILFQMTSLPPSAIKLLSPKTYEIYSQTLDGYPNGGERTRYEFKEMQDIESRGQKLEVRAKTEDNKTEGYFENWRTLSIYPHATRTEFLKIMSYLGVFLLIINYVDSKRKLMRISTIIVFSGILVALLGITQKVIEAPKIYWFWDALFKKDASFFGPFVNPNHFAGYIEMAIPLSIGLFIVKWRHMGREPLRSIREFLIKIGDEEGCKLILLSFLIVLMVGALFLSSSRGGVISFLGSMIYLLLMVTKRERGKRNIFIIAGLLIAVFSFLIWLGIKPLVEEFSSIQNLSRDYDLQYRFQNWKDSTILFQHFPIFGAGLKTFSTIFPQFKTIDLQYYYLYLENDYLQLLCEMGIVGFGIFLWFILSFFRHMEWGNLKHEGKGMSSLNYISLYGCLTGVVAIVIHSFWDFNMHIPSNALLLSMIMGLALAGVRIGSEGHSQYPRERVSWS